MTDLIAVGTYTSRHPFGSPIGQAIRNLLSAGKPRAAGIYLVPFDSRDGHMGEPTLAARLEHPSWLVRHPRLNVVYATSEVLAGKVTALRVTGGRLEPIGTAPTGGSAPCYVTVNEAGTLLFATNYASGTVAVIALQPDGSMGHRFDLRQHSGSGRDPQRQRSAHPHSVALSPDGRWAVVPDLGADRIFIYRIDPQAGLLPDPAFASASAGAGPRHAAFDLTGEHVLVVNELDSTVQSYRFESESGRLEPVGRVSTLPGGWKGTSTAADVRLHPDGRLAFVSNRGHDSITTIHIGDRGRLEVASIHNTGGRTPRGLAVHPAGGFLLAAHQDSDEVISFAIDAAGGALRAAMRTRIPTCASVVFL